MADKRARTRGRQEDPADDDQPDDARLSEAKMIDAIGHLAPEEAERFRGWLSEKDRRLVDSWVPAWVDEAEADYVSGQVPSYEALSHKYGKAKDTIASWASKLKWRSRREALQKAAREKHRRELEEDGAGHLANMYGKIHGRLLMTLDFLSMIAAVRLKHEWEQVQADPGHKPVGLPRGMDPDAVMSLYHRLVPPEQRDEAAHGGVEELGSLLNPRSPEPAEDDGPGPDDGPEDPGPEDDGSG